jgi:hypothetical protein
MELPKSWIDKAEAESWCSAEYKNGAQEMLDAIEAEINYLKSIGSNGRIYANDLLKLLKSIKPL